LVRPLCIRGGDEIDRARKGEKEAISNKNRTNCRVIPSIDKEVMVYLSEYGDN
jgi:hypothetical protein